MKEKITILGATVNIMLEQEPDCCSDSETQILEVEFKDGGGGSYPVFKTEEWAIDSPEDFVRLLSELHIKVRDLNNEKVSAF